MGAKANLKTALVMAVFLLGMVGTTFAEQLMPLQVGGRYEYKRSDPCNNEWTVRFELNGHMTIDSLDYFYLQVWNYDNDSAFEDEGYIRSTEEAVYGYNPNGEDYLELQKAPIGTKWSFYQEHNSGYNYKVIEIVDINQVTVPYGTFDEAYKHRRYRCVDPNDVNENNKSKDWYEWVVPGVGWVKQEDWGVEDPAPVNMGLVSIMCEGGFDSNSAVITNPWLGLTDIGDSYRLAGYGSFGGATRVYALTPHPLTGTENVLGVECLIGTISIHDANGTLTEYHHGWIAQDTCGNIRLLRVTGRDNEGPIEWQADSLSEAPIFLPADPCVGQRFTFYVAGEYYEVIALDQNMPQMSTGLGPYSGCMQYRWSDDNDINPDIDDKWFCPNVGAVKEEWNDGGTNGWERTTQSPISNHLYSIEISQGWDYEYPNTPLMYEITFGVQTDPNVELVEFNSPVGYSFQIPKIPKQCSENVCTVYGCDDETCYWEYHAFFPSEANLADYGNGNYTVTVHYDDDSNDQTVAWFGIPATSDPIHQITQEPNLTFPDHNSVIITCPVTFEWESCADSNVNVIVLALENYETGELVHHVLLPDTNSLDNVELSAGSWEARLSFGERYLAVPNNDGVRVGVSKYSEGDRLFTIINRADLNGDGIVNFVDYAIFTLAWLTEDEDAQWNPDCDISCPKDNVIDWLDMDVFTDYWLAGHL